MGEIITKRNRIKNKIGEKLKKLMMKNEVISTKIVQKTLVMSIVWRVKQICRYFSNHMWCLTQILRSDCATLIYKLIIHFSMTISKVFSTFSVNNGRGKILEKYCKFVWKTWKTWNFADKNEVAEQKSHGNWPENGLENLENLEFWPK